MVRIFKTEDGVVRQIEAVENGCWVALTDPTATEILEVAEQFGIDPDDGDKVEHDGVVLLWMRRSGPVLRVRIPTA